MDDKYKYYQYLDKTCPICYRKNVGLYSIYTVKERHFRCFCCWDCYRYINYINDKSNRGEYNYYEVPILYYKIISKVLSVAFGNEDKPSSLHLPGSLYFHPNSRTVGDDPMLM